MNFYTFITPHQLPKRQGKGNIMDYQKIACIIETKLCVSHNVQPIATVVGNAIELRCCCVCFDEELRAEIIIEKEKQNLENIRKFLHGIKS